MKQILTLLKARPRPAQLINAAKAYLHLMIPPLSRSFHIHDHLPVSFGIYINLECNLRCPHCYFDWNKISPEVARPISIARFTELLEHPLFSKALRCTLSGAEPLLHPEIATLIALAKQRRLLTTLTTNGTLLVKKSSLILKAGLDSMVISLYNDCAKQTSAGVRVLMEEHARARSPMTITLSKIVNDQNYREEMETTISFAKEHGIKNLFFQNIYTTPQTMGQGHGIQASDQIYRQYVNELRRRCARDRLHVTFPLLLRKDPLAHNYCIFLSTVLNVDARGAISPCCFLAPPDDRYGNIYTQEDPWNNTFYGTLRQALHDPARTIPPYCQECPVLSQSIIKAF